MTKIIIQALLIFILVMLERREVYQDPTTRIRRSLCRQWCLNVGRLSLICNLSLGTCGIGVDIPIPISVTVSVERPLNQNFVSE